MKLGRGDLMFPHCWVCGRRFKSSVPPGPANREDHHICPRNAGGTDGPLVSLCDSHHTGLHKIAERLHRKASYTDLLVGESKSMQQRLMWLAVQVVKSEQQGDTDPDRRFGSSLSLSAQEIQMMKRIQSVTGKTREEVFRAGLILVYQKFFT